jgi:3-hydroxybutyryl-CoA dehydrogenase
MHTPCELRRIAVIGAGNAGLDFTLRCVRFRFDVTLEDVMPSRLRRAEQTAGSIHGPGKLRLASTVEDAVRDADLAVDFVPDELESKLEIFSMLDRMAPPHTILCTPSTALSIADLASCTYRPQLCFALRFPAPDVATLIHTAHSAPQALLAVQSWIETLGFTITTELDPARH